MLTTYKVYTSINDHQARGRSLYYVNATTEANAISKVYQLYSSKTITPVRFLEKYEIPSHTVAIAI